MQLQYNKQALGRINVNKKEDGHYEGRIRLLKKGNIEKSKLIERGSRADGRIRVLKKMDEDMASLEQFDGKIRLLKRMEEDLGKIRILKRNAEDIALLLG